MSKFAVTLNYHGNYGYVNMIAKIKKQKLF